MLHTKIIEDRTDTPIKNAKPLNSNTVTLPERMGSVDRTTVAVVVVSSESYVDVEVAPMVAVLEVVVTAVLASGQHVAL